MQVRNLMRSPVVTVDPDQSLQQAAQVMQEHGRVADHMTAPVVTASPNWDVSVAAAEMQGAAAGVLSVRDVMSVFLPERVHCQEA
jgi:CBS domain-containing protein